MITGAGEKGFCAGADIGGDLTASDETAARIINRALLKTTTFSKPIIAAVNGDCAGGGVELLLATDIRSGCATCPLRAAGGALCRSIRSAARR